MRYLMIFLSLITFPLLAPGQNGPSNSSTEQNQLTIDFVLHNGKILKLSDGSIWKIAPQDINTSSVWILAPPIEIKKNEDPKTNKAYPYRIINKTTDSCVLASPISGKINQDK